MSCKLDSRQLVTVQYQCSCDPYTLCVACVQRVTKCPEHPQYQIESKSEPRGQNRAFPIQASERNLYLKDVLAVSFVSLIGHVSKSPSMNATYQHTGYTSAFPAMNTAGTA